MRVMRNVSVCYYIYYIIYSHIVGAMREIIDEPSPEGEGICREIQSNIIVEANCVRPYG